MTHATITPRVDALLAQMTLDEKLAQLGSFWFYELQTNGALDAAKIENKLAHGIGQITRVAGASMLAPQAAARAGNALQKFLVEQTRLGIPAILHEESCAGTMILGGTTFPQMIGLAGTFEPALAEAMTREIREQLLAIGARQALAPVLDVARDPRWGRTEETFGEDPTLVSHFGVAYIRGLQTNHLSHGVLATGKHFIGHSLSQGGQNCAPVHVGWRELYDVFLMPFQAAIREAGLATIMNAYPEVDGEVVAASRQILTDLLREKLGFDGLVVSDYEAVLMLNNFHHLASSPALAGRLALQAGIDVELPTTVCYDAALKAALDSGALNLETVDTAVRRHLHKKFELGLFETPYVDESKVRTVFETPAQRTLAREIAAKSMTLLKNNGILPLPQTLRSVAVIGPNADSGRNLLGDYSYAATLELMRFQAPPDSDFVASGDDTPAESVQTVSVLQGILAARPPATFVYYAQGCATLGADTSGFAEAVAAAQQADAVILVLGDSSGLVPACSTGETRDSVDLRLPGVQEQLAQAIFATGKPVVVVLVNGRPYALSWLHAHAHAILEAWLPGEEGGNAIADVLFGNVNPGGKLPITFPRHVGQVPIVYNHKPSGMKSHWYGDYVTEKATPLYPFGHGLSYTQFAYRDLKLAREQVYAGETLEIEVTVSNCGKMRGDEVVQLYVRDEFASTPRPMQELKGYQRLTLAAGESKTLTFCLPVNQLAFYDNEFNLVVEAGDFSVMVGSSSTDIRLNGKFEVIGADSTAVAERVFACPVIIKDA